MKEQPRTTKIKPLVVSSCAGLSASLLILFIAAWAVSAGRMTDTNVSVITAMFVGSLITALGATAYFKNRRLVVGLTAALSFFLLIFLLGGLLYFRLIPTSSVVAMLLASLAAGVTAGLLPQKKKKRRG
ncbi:MAG: TIGR04086 family membrane protein [Oscillospiraceae bacterium]|nr:TIGR04086 family membrane protein [Oscillospiraceae bacterium]